MELTTEASCFLCNKDTCATSHILGACKVILSQERFTFRHDNVLRIIISNIRSSIKTIKSCSSYFKATHKNKICKKRNQSKKQKFFSQWDITSGIRLGLVRGSRWHFFLSTSHSIYWTKARHYYLFKQAKKSDPHRTDMPMWRKHGGLAQCQS